MKVELIARDGRVFDTVEIREHADYVNYNERVWKRKGNTYFEQKAVFVPLPAQDMWSAPHSHRAVPAQTPPKQFNPETPLLGS